MKIKITAIRKASYPDLMAKYENPIEHTCDVLEEQEWISVDGKCPEGMCPSAWGSMREFVEALKIGIFHLNAFDTKALVLKNL
ncbi:MAG: hypothetical protein IIT50_08005 [Bacteroidales bacterium]|nr:hypothetical protein [Bacteroidales bacterium]